MSVAGHPDGGITDKRKTLVFNNAAIGLNKYGCTTDQ